MKKLISITLLCVMLLSAMIVWVQADENENYISPKLEKYLVENIDHYFLPQGYDIGFAGGSIEFQEDFIDNKIVRDGDKIIVPPIVTLCDCTYDNQVSVDTAAELTSTAKTYFKEKNTPLNDNMLRTIYLGNESAIRSFVAPWTLYNAKTGELYTWNELMAMSESELENLEFETPDFEKFITNVKSELEVRGWWKEEYQAKYDILASHKNDYKNTLDENENFIVNGETCNFATMNYEFQASNVKVENNITCVNIFTDDFYQVYANASEVIKVKYQEMFDILNKTNNNVPYGGYYDYIYGQELGRIYIIDNITSLTEQQREAIKQSKNEYENASTLWLLQLIEEYGVTEEELKNAIDKFNYTAPFWRVFGNELMNQFFSANSKYEAMSLFTNSNGVIVSEKHSLIMPIDAFSTDGFNEREMDKIKYTFDCVDDIIKQIKAKANSGDFSPNEFDEAVKYLENLLNSESPSTGENTALYIAIAGAAVVAMTTLVVRKKKKIA